MAARERATGLGGGAAPSTTAFSSEVPTTPTRLTRSASRQNPTEFKYLVFSPKSPSRTKSSASTSTSSALSHSALGAQALKSISNLLLQASNNVPSTTTFAEATATTTTTTATSASFNSAKHTAPILPIPSAPATKASIPPQGSIEPPPPVSNDLSSHSASHLHGTLRSADNTQSVPLPPPASPCGFVTLLVFLLMLGLGLLVLAAPNTLAPLFVAKVSAAVPSPASTPAKSSQHTAHSPSAATTSTSTVSTTTSTTTTKKAVDIQPPTQTASTAPITLPPKKDTTIAPKKSGGSGANSLLCKKLYSALKMPRSSPCAHTVLLVGTGVHGATHRCGLGGLTVDLSATSPDPSNAPKAKVMEHLRTNPSGMVVLTGVSRALTNLLLLQHCFDDSDGAITDKEQRVSCEEAQFILEFEVPSNRISQLSTPGSACAPSSSSSSSEHTSDVCVSEVREKVLAPTFKSLGVLHYDALLRRMRRTVVVVSEDHVV